MLAATARIAHAVDLPVMAAIVSGYGATSDALTETVRAVIATGAVGINIADGLHASGPSRAIDDAVARIRRTRTAAEQAGVPIVIDAHTDTCLRPFGDSPALRLDETVRRGRGISRPIPTVSIGLAWRMLPLSRPSCGLYAPINVTKATGLPRWPCWRWIRRSGNFEPAGASTGWSPAWTTRTCKPYSTVEPASEGPHRCWLESPLSCG